MQEDKKWIRGVNLGGWLVMERYIVPYQFSITSCHTNDDLCWYPGALSAPGVDHPDYKLCDVDKCKPVRFDSVFGWPDYPVDEWHLSKAFPNQTTAERWINFHFENFVTRDDLLHLKTAGITHLRVPLPHWILGNIASNERWIPGDRWKYFLRLCEWCREIGLEVWPNLHTAPGSQNGFDNSGIQNTVYTCGGWDKAHNIQRTLDIINQITFQMMKDGVSDVVTGFGILNEPFWDCNMDSYKRFLRDSLSIVRNNMGGDVGVFVSDKFAAPLLNDGTWWLDEELFNNTYLDTHFYQVFDPEARGYPPQQHIDMLCQPAEEEYSMKSCCYEDAPNNTIPSKGVQRISTEWSAAFDSMPGELLQIVMLGIYENHTAPDFDRVLSPKRKSFLKKFVEAQIVSFEAADAGVGQGWFYWTMKVEGGAFAEWDFSRGVREGWIPTIAPPNQASVELYGTCEEISKRTTEDMSVVHPYPWGDEPYWTEEKWKDFVDNGKESGFAIGSRFHDSDAVTSVAIVAAVLFLYVFRRCSRGHRNNKDYTRIDDIAKE